MKLTLTQRSYHRILRLIGHAFFLILLIFSGLFYQERTLNFDTAFYTFNILYFQDFYIPHQRIINYASEIFPYLAMQAGWSLNNILLLYSLSFMLLFYGLFNLVVYGFKNPEGGIFMALCVCLTVRYKFYAAISEVFFSLALAGVFISWLTKDEAKFSNLSARKNTLIACLLALLLATAHPMIILPVLVYFAFDLCYRNRWQDGQNWLIIGCTVIIFGLKFWLIPQGGYEAGRMTALSDMFGVFENLQDKKVYHIVKLYFEKEYAFSVLIFMSLLGIMLWQKRWWSVAVLLVSVVLLVWLILVIYSYLGAHVYAMIDGYLGLLGVIFALPILYVVLQSNQYWWSIVLTVALLAYSLDRIHEKHTFFEKRLQYFSDFMEKNAEPDRKKLLIHMRHFNWEKLWYPWAVPYETLLLSSLKGPEHAKVVYYLEYGEELSLDKGRYFVAGKGQYNQFLVKTLPQRYFRLDENPHREIENVPVPD